MRSSIEFFDNLQLSFIEHSIYLLENKIMVSMKRKKYLIDVGLLSKGLVFFVISVF